MAVFLASATWSARLLLPLAFLLLQVSTAPAYDKMFNAISGGMEEFIQQGEITGAVTLFATNGEIRHLGAVGMADVENQLPMTSDTVFRIRSMTKPITATALMILVDEGKLSIDDPVEKYIPAFGDAQLPRGEEIEGLTIFHLLTHTSGMVGEQRCEETLEATAQMLAERNFGFRPFEKWKYSPGMNVVGRIIEVVSGQPYDEFLTERIFQPLGMNNSAFYPSEHMWSRTAVVYEKDNATGALVPTTDPQYLADGRPGTAPNPSGGLFSTAEDVFRFYQMILQGGTWEGQRIVSEDAVMQMTKPQTGDLQTGFTPGNAWGLGWCVIRQPQGVTAMFSPGSFGHGGRYGTQVWVDPQKQAIFLLMIQREGLPNSDASDIRRDFQDMAIHILERKASQRD